MEELEEDYGITSESLAQAMSSHVSGWLCEDSDVVVGFSMGDRLNGEIQVVAVLPEYEGHGIGKNLLTKVQSWLFSKGHETIWLGANSWKPSYSVKNTKFFLPTTAKKHWKWSKKFRRT